MLCLSGNVLPLIKLIPTTPSSPFHHSRAPPRKGAYI
ncbi:unnamed protein product [Chondrus crispus]|uniref:Uncharacterized protein n=1 Tax=Chondrus crispus TaxID=2769 RepID=R7Q530_CHOCR|nr:unnamed protein product [Chondrus crispus]CDF33124.1 unnamed protein product [Chondrus crispus]|eukprot:XP_005712927.1 unnamed protein product [Chondrus crispus]